MRLLTKILLLLAAAVVFTGAGIESSPTGETRAGARPELAIVPAGSVPADASWASLFHANWR